MESSTLIIAACFKQKQKCSYQMKEMDPPEQKLKKFKLEVNEDGGKIC